MPIDALSSFIDFIQQHPGLAFITVFIIAFTESLAIVGLIVPGAVFMVTAGALIAVGVLPFWPTTLIATLGAVLGDTLSFWLGHKYKSRLYSIWPLSKHPELIERAQNFFIRHGTKGVVLARFVGPLRPVIPAIAGMASMNKNAFLFANIVSALFWAPLYLLPGIIFGLSFEIASDFAGQFILSILVLVVSSWLLYRAYNRGFQKLLPQIHRVSDKLIHWGQQHALLGEIPAAIFDSRHKETRGLIYFSLLLLLVSLTFVTLNSFIPVIPRAEVLNKFVFNLLQERSNPLLQDILFWVIEFSNKLFVTIFVLLVGLYLILTKRIFVLWYWLFAISIPFVFVLLTANFDSTAYSFSVLQTPQHYVSTFVFFSVYVFSIRILPLNFLSKFRGPVYLFMTIALLSLCLAQLYFGLLTLSFLFFSLIFSIIWTGLIATAHHQHRKNITETRTSKTVLSLFVILLCAHVIVTPLVAKNTTSTLVDKLHYTYTMGLSFWHDEGWQRLPTQRKSFMQEQPFAFNVQWAGDVLEIKRQLNRHKFMPSTLVPAQFANWFISEQPLNHLPILPHVHDGVYEQLRYYLFDEERNELITLRLWKSDYTLKQDNYLVPLWIGSMNRMSSRHHLGMNYLVSEKVALKNLQSYFSPDTQTTIYKRDEEEVILLQ